MKTDLIAPAYAYQQYSDDENITAFFSAYNDLIKETISWMVGHPMALYIGTALTGDLLTYCAYCLYGQFRYKISYTELRSILGPINSTDVNRFAVNETSIDKRYSGTTISDDLFKRVLTWNFYKGDGLNFSVPWLKRRVMRFLTGENGHAWRFNNTLPVSVTTEGRKVSITITPNGIDSDLIAILGRIISNGILNIPPSFVFSISIASP